MGAVGTDHLTLVDLATRMEKGEVAKHIIELLAQRNPLTHLLPWVECNDGSGHITTVRTGIPEPTWRQLYGGVNQTKSTTAQVRDGCGMLENYSTVDKSLADRAKDKQKFLLSESKPFMQGFDNSFMSALLYGNAQVNPERFNGLSMRFNALSGAENSQNILTGGGSSNCTSVWLLVLGEQSVCGIYPEGSKAGFHQQDLGEQTVYDAEGKPFQAYRSHYKWDCGISVRDWRQAVRIPNIDVTALKKDAQSGADLIDLMVQALEKVEDLGAGRPVFLANRTITSFLRRQMMNKSNVNLSLDEVAGKKVMHFGEVPVIRTDALLNSESAVA